MDILKLLETCAIHIQTIALEYIFSEATNIMQLLYFSLSTTLTLTVMAILVTTSWDLIKKICQQTLSIPALLEISTVRATEL